MSSKFEPDLAVDTNISHTLLQDNVMLSLNALTNLLEKACPCTLREIFHSHLRPIDVTHYSIEIQLQILTCLVSKRYNSTCFTEDDNTAISIKCFLSPDREICISNWIVTQEETSKFQSETSQLPVDSKLHLACLVRDHHYVKCLMEQEPRTDLKTLLFYGISCVDIVNILVEKGAEVNAKDERRRTPLFYAITSSSVESARILLKKNARVDLKDTCSVSVLTLFAENMLKNGLPIRPMKDEGFQLLSTKGITQKKLVKEVINLFFCKFFQGYLGVSLLCKTLKWILSQNNSSADEINALIHQLESTSPDDTVTFDAVQPIFDILHKLGAKPSSRDSEGNTCLHYAIRSLFQGVSPKNITCLFEKLMELDAKLVDAKNHKNETPLLFCLSSKFLIAHSQTRNWSRNLHIVCKVLVEKGSQLRHTTHKEESVFQLILKVCQHAILQDEIQTRCIFKEMLKILEVFSNETNASKVAVNKRDVHLNSPLHLWASLALKPDSKYCDNVYDDQSFKDLLKKTLDLLLKCGVKLDDINEKNQKPLHMCRTWTAVKLLLEVEASPNGTDSSGCTPLLAAAMKNACLKDGTNRFYPDVTEDPIEFWKEVIERKLDPWTADKNGDSVLSILIEKEAVRLAETLVEVACEQNYVQSDKIGVPLLAAICRDISNDKRWKFDLVKKLLDTQRSLVNGTLNGDTPLIFSCRNILMLSDESAQKSVHWEIVEHLLLCGADVPSDLSSDHHVLGNLLSTPVDYTKMPPVFKNWKQSSEKHSQQLSLVARMINYQQVNTLYFCKEALYKDTGSFGFVFAGIVQSSGSREDGREVTVKRIAKSNMPNKSGSESVLSPHTYSEQIVHYLFCEQDPKFHYIAFELMEGDLEDYLDMPRSPGCEETTKLCQQLVMGLEFLHSECIVHGNINPRTVFYQSKPNLCLKIGNCKTTSPRGGWIPSEVLQMDKPSFSNESDMFSSGLVLHYLMSGKKHPFAPDDDPTTKTQEDVLHETEENILNNNIVKLDDSLSPEATHLVQLMIDRDTMSRPSPADALVHPFFWDNKTKKKFLHAVGNEPEIAIQTKQHPLTAFETELENRFGTIVTRGSEWNDKAKYPNISKTYAGMNSKVKPNYKYSTIAGLIRFIRNAYEHINEQTVHIQGMWGNDFVLTDNDYFPHLVIEVYKALTRSDIHQLHKSRKEIKKFLEELK